MVSFCFASSERYEMVLLKTPMASLLGTSRSMKSAVMSEIITSFDRYCFNASSNVSKMSADSWYAVKALETKIFSKVDFGSSSYCCAIDEIT